MNPSSTYTERSELDLHVCVQRYVCKIGSTGSYA